MFNSFKTIGKNIVFVFLILFVLAVIFFFWAKSPNWSKEQYAQIRHFPTDQSQSETAETSDATISLLTYNIGYLSGMTNNTAVRPSQEFYQQNMDGALDSLRQYNADILALQEIDFGSKRSYYLDQFEEIGEKVPYKNGAMVVNWDKKYVPFPYFPVSVHFGQVLSGQAILSNYDILEQERVKLAAVDSQPFYYSAIYLHRLAQRVKVNIAGRDVMLFNVHTEAFDAPTRMQQIKFLKEWFLQVAQTMPVIMMGDFNSDSRYESDDLSDAESNKNSAAILQFYDDPRIGTTSAKESLSQQHTLTYPSDKPTEQLDYIFFSSTHFELITAKVLTDFGQVSDHLPFYAELRFK